jgi:hypothetical protein
MEVHRPKSVSRSMGLLVPGSSVWLIWFLLWITGLLFLCTIGKTVIIDSNFTNRPEKYPSLWQISGWTSTPENSLPVNLPPGTQTVLTRTATRPLMLVTLRYMQLSSDNGTTAETFNYDVDIRWKRIFAAIVTSAIVLLSACLVAGIMHRFAVKAENTSD